MAGSLPRRPSLPQAGALFAGWFLLFAAVALGHATLLRLPYFWDEGGYYVPAALDFYQRGTLIPRFTNAHPPLPNVVLGLLWHLFGYHFLVTRLTVCGFAALGLLAVYQMGKHLLGRQAAWAVTALVALYPIWFAQSSLAHADIFAAAFSLSAFALYFTAPEQLSAINSQGADGAPGSSPQRLAAVAVLFSLSVLAKETAILQPLTLATLAGLAVFGQPRQQRPTQLRWLTPLCAPFPVLALWFGYHRWKTGFTFGNPEFLRYNATANLTFAHIARSFGYRFLHLFWQRDVWVPLVFALACLWLPRRSGAFGRSLPLPVLRSIGALILVNWLAFSVLGGALLTRYLLPMYPLLLLVCVSVWQSHTVHWPWLAWLTGAAFFSALWLNPPTYFAPEDNLTYRDMIVVHQEAIAFLQQHEPQAVVLSAWPADAELTRPDLGYTDHAFRVHAIENFTAPEIAKAAQEPGQFDTALVFSTQYIAPALGAYLLSHPDSRRGRKYAVQRDLSPAEIARRLGGRVVWQDDRNGEWAAVLRFDRSYNAQLPDVHRSGPNKRHAPDGEDGCSSSATLVPSSFTYTSASSPGP